MSVPTNNATVLLTEHLEFPPISLIDDIINAVNEIMYKCTGALEKYLNSKKNGLIDEEEELDEIEVGTAQLETLFESSIDKNFDLFELYSLRNILNLPNELVDEGWVKLKHYEHVKKLKNFNNKKYLKDVNSRIKKLEESIKYQLFLKRQLLGILKKSRDLSKLLKLYHKQLNFLKSNPPNIRNNSNISRQIIISLRSLSPIDESIFFLKNEAKNLYKIIDALNNKFELLSSNDKLLLKPNDRDTYVDTKAYKLLKLYYSNNFKGNNNLNEDIINIRLNKIHRTTKEIEEIKSVNNVLKIVDL